MFFIIMLISHLFSVLLWFAWEMKRIFLAACFFPPVHFKLQMEEKCSCCQKQGSSHLKNSWQWRIVSLISATISSLFILSIFIFFTVLFFSISFLWYVNVVTVYYYLCSLYLPSPLFVCVCVWFWRVCRIRPRCDCEHVCMWKACH